MQYIRKASSRGSVDLGWLKSQHTFSFGDYYDPAHIGISALRVINDDSVAPKKGFATHGHQDMEIISYVISGAVAHKDSEGNESVIPAGDVQVMSAGSGIRHSEFNPSDSDAAHFLQIWIQPNKKGLTPAYGQMTIMPKGTLTPLVTSDGREGSLQMNQDASIYKVLLVAKEELSLATHTRKGYLHIVKGIINTQEQSFSAGDGFAVEPNTVIELHANKDVEALWFDLP